MGIINDIDDTTVNEYEDFLGENIAENLSREYFSGIASCDVNYEPKGAVVWKLSNVDSFDDIRSELIFFSAEDEETAEELLDQYEEKVIDEDIEKTFFELSGISEEILDIFKKKGFKIKKRESIDLYVKLKDITSNRIFMPKKKPKFIISLSELDQLTFRQGITNCLFNGISGLNDDLAFLPKDWYEEDISCAYVEDDRVTGFFLIHVLPDGSIMPVLLFASGVDSNINILEMLRYSALAASKKYDASTDLIIRRHDDKSKKLSFYLFPKAKGAMVHAGEKTSKK
ncbi:MAG: hypothetical protein K6G03_10805 [Lachnospiraceae bacterium]|nr:hypothetical protein [Lachnospiraceae bacterium]